MGMLLAPKACRARAASTLARVTQGFSVEFIYLRAKALQHDVMSLGQIHMLIDQDSGEEFAHGQTIRARFQMRTVSYGSTPTQIAKLLGVSLAFCI
jgi:hypothetical protein